MSSSRTPPPSPPSAETRSPDNTSSSQPASTSSSTAAVAPPAPAPLPPQQQQQQQHQSLQPPPPPHHHHHHHHHRHHHNKNRHHHQQQQPQKPPPQQQQQQPPPPPNLEPFIDRLRQHYWDNNPSSNLNTRPSVDEVRARYLLEASAGNIDLAVMLYWESGYQHQDNAAGAAGGGVDYHSGSSSNSHGAAPPAAAAAAAAAGDRHAWYRDRERRVRRRLAARAEVKHDSTSGNEKKVAGREETTTTTTTTGRSSSSSSSSSTSGQAAMASGGGRRLPSSHGNAAAGGGGGEEEGRGDDVGSRLMNARRNGSLGERNEQLEGVASAAAASGGDVHQQDQQQPPQPPQQQPNQNDNNAAEAQEVPDESNNNSVSISDDEAAAAGGMMMDMFMHESWEDSNNDVVDDDLTEDDRNARQRQRQRMKRVPWNRRSDRQRGHNNSRRGGGGSGKPHRAGQIPAASPVDDGMSTGGGSPNASDGEEDQQETDVDAGTPLEVLWGVPPSAPPPDPNPDDELTETLPIPSPWLNAEFTLSSCQTGLYLPFPSSSSSSSSRRNTTPRHCGGTTAILSIITSLIQSSASIQGKKVSCGSSRKRFSDLKEEDKSREFESRLADALSSILHTQYTAKVTAMAAAGQANSSSKETSTTTTTRQSGGGRRRRRPPLCTVCSWEKEEGDATNTSSAGRKKVGEALSTSQTNPADLRAYVLSHSDSFTSPGGIALFLEGVLRIHGTKRIKSMVKAVGGTLPLIRCRCAEQVQQKRTNSRQRGRSGGGGGEDTREECDGHGCVSVELMSLLLTGEISTTFRISSVRMDTIDRLGVGLFTSVISSDPVDRDVDGRFIRPKKPVWIVRGEKMYSVLWLEDENEKKYMEDKMMEGSSSSNAFHLIHWNTWDGIKTRMRIITAPKRHPAAVLSSSFVGKKTTTGDDENKTPVKNDASDDAVTLEDISHVRFHSDDHAHYPNEYKRWRFQFVEDGDDDDKKDETKDKVGSSNTDDKKTVDNKPDKTMTPIVDDSWVPYFRLAPRRKRVVDHKHAPKINTVIWSRWKRATVDEFTDKKPPIV